MQFGIITSFPDFFAGPLDYGIVRRAREARLMDVRVHDLRTYAHDRHRTVDDRPFGGGEGMVLKPEPLFEAVESLLGEGVQHGGHCGDSDVVGARHAVPLHETTRSGSFDRPNSNETAIALLSASGKLFRQDTARRFAQLDRIILLCGRYEGVDERVAEHLATDELSIGDFVLSGRELGAAIMRRFAAGARRGHWRKRGGTGPTFCWPNHRTPGSAPVSESPTSMNSESCGRVPAHRDLW